MVGQIADGIGGVEEVVFDRSPLSLGRYRVWKVCVSNDQTLPSSLVTRTR